MAEYEQTLHDIEALLANIDRCIKAHRDPDANEVERLMRWRRELVLERADLLDLQQSD